MNLFDEFVNRAKDVVDVAGKKTGELVEVSKLKLQAVQINSDIGKAYERLGAIVYEQAKAGTDNSDLIAVCVSEIDALLASLEELNEKIDESKTGSRCPNCGANNPEAAVFCSRCGSHLSANQYGSETIIVEVQDSDETEPSQQEAESEEQ